MIVASTVQRTEKFFTEQNFDQELTVAIFSQNSRVQKECRRKTKIWVKTRIGST